MAGSHDAGISSLATIWIDEEDLVPSRGHAGRNMKRSVAVGLLVTALSVSVACSRPPNARRPPDILLITVDTLRADALSPYGSIDTRTPNMERIAQDGVVYEAATTPITVTHPAHSSILTGLYPDQHGVLHNGQVLPDDVVTLAEILKGFGYQTGGFVGVRFLGRKSGLGQGFDLLDAPVDRVQRRAKPIVDRAVNWLGGADSQAPVLMWVHLFDPHQSYNPPPAFRRGVDPELEDRVSEIRWKTLNTVARDNAGDVPAEVLEYALELYRGEVEYTDQQLGRLLQSFDALRARSQSMVVLTADHGECFENGIHFDHQDCLYEGTVRVPLIVRFPGGAGAGVRVEHRVSNLDIVPSILSELGAQMPEILVGRPLQETIAGSGGRFVLVRPPKTRHPDRVIPRLRVIRSVAGKPVAGLTDPRTRGLVSQAWKYLQAPGSEQLFRLPDEVRSLSATDEETRRRLRNTLEMEQGRFPVRAPAAEADDEETLEMLEALGYIQ
jgi:arylsulfatase A-like enzyme